MVEGSWYRSPQSLLTSKMKFNAKQWVLKQRIIAVGFTEFNQQLPYDKAQTLKPEGEKCQNSHNCVGKTFKVEGVGGLTFARSYEWVSFTLFLKPDDFFFKLQRRFD